MSPRWVFSSPESVDLDLISKITFQSDFDVSKIKNSRVRTRRRMRRIIRSHVLRRKSPTHKLFIQSHHQEKGFSTLAFSKNYDNDTIEFIIPDNIENISLFYEISNGNNSILQKGTLDINSEIIPQEFILYPAFPNPFNPSTTISFDIPNDGLYESVYLNIYDLRGRLIKKLINGIVLPGNYNLHWDASNSSSGIYFIQLISDKEIKTQKIIYLK